jgi:hypothetical protein
MVGLPIFLAGSYWGGAAMKDAIASGFAAADAILRAHPAPPRHARHAPEVRP